MIALKHHIHVNYCKVCTPMMITPIIIAIVMKIRYLPKLCTFIINAIKNHISLTILRKYVGINSFKLYKEYLINRQHINTRLVCVYTVILLYLIKVFFLIKRKDKLSYTYNYLKCKTVESSFFVEDQCLWLQWVTLAHKFTSPRTYTQFIV